MATHKHTFLSRDDAARLTDIEKTLSAILDEARVEGVAYEDIPECETCGTRHFGRPRGEQCALPDGFPENESASETAARKIKVALRFSEVCASALRGLNVECSDEIAETLGVEQQAVLQEALDALEGNTPAQSGGSDRARREPEQDSDEPPRSDDEAPVADSAGLRNAAAAVVAAFRSTPEEVHEDQLYARINRLGEVLDANGPSPCESYVRETLAGDADGEREAAPVAQAIDGEGLTDANPPRRPLNDLERRVELDDALRGLKDGLFAIWGSAQVIEERASEDTEVGVAGLIVREAYRLQKEVLEVVRKAAR